MIIIPYGTYAVFIHNGSARLGAATYRYIFEQGLPSAEYLLDQRPFCVQTANTCMRIRDRKKILGYRCEKNGIDGGAGFILGQNIKQNENSNL